MAGDYVWSPSAELLERSNVARFMRRHGHAGARELVAWSIDHPERFWGAVVEDLDIAFFRPYQSIVDASAGAPWGRWFTGGLVNLAHHCLDRRAAAGPAQRARTAVIWEGENGAVRRWSYGELHAETCRLAGALSRLGAARGDRIGLFLPMSPEAVAAFLACAKIGAVAVPIFSGHGAAAVATRLEDAEASVLIAAESSARRGRTVAMGAVAREAARACPSVRHVVIARNERADGPKRSDERSIQHSDERFHEHDWSELVAGGPSEWPSEPLDPESPLMIAYTSGTTGRPKGAVHVHGGFLVKIAQEAAHQVDMSPDDALFWVTDLGWIMGPWSIVGALAAGGTVVLAEGAPDWPAADRIWGMIARHRVTVLGVSPTLVRALNRHGRDPVHAHDLSSLRVLASTGEPWDETSWRWLFETVGRSRLPIVNFTGGTEVGACLLSALPVTPLKPCSLVGPALGMAVAVFDPNGRPLGAGEGVGELVCTRPWPAMTRGLWRDPDRYLETYWSRWPDVWTHGDWASIDSDGDWFLHGRSDDTIKIAGKRLGPAEVESALAGCAAVAESAAVGVPSAVKGEALLCYVVLRPGHAPDAPLREALRQRVADALGRSFLPEDVRFVAGLPKTRSGKVARRVIQRIASGRDPGDLSSIDNLDAVEALRLDRLRETGPSGP